MLRLPSSLVPLSGPALPGGVFFDASVRSGEGLSGGGRAGFSGTGPVGSAIGKMQRPTRLKALGMKTRQQCHRDKDKCRRRYGEIGRFGC